MQDFPQRTPPPSPSQQRQDPFPVRWLAAPPPRPGAKLLAATALAFLLLVVAGGVHASGGTSVGLTHFFYFPILLAATLFGVKGGLGAGLMAGLLMGPWMPQHSELHLQQAPLTWIVRMACYTLVGGFAGLLMHAIRRHQEHLHWAAFHSGVTGLPNRSALLCRIDALMARKRTQSSLAVQAAGAGLQPTLLLVRIKNFDQIIEALGAHVGDGLIRAVVSRMSETLGGEHPIFDLGSQKVGMLLAASKEALDAYVERTHQMPDQPLLVDGLPIYADLVLGTAEIDAEAESAEAIIQRANIALAEAGRREQCLVHYDKESEASRRKHVELLAYLPQAIDKRELFLEYQPKVDLRSGRPVGAEALLRWQHPALGRVPPGDFIPLAEGTTLIHPLTRLVFYRTAQDYHHLHQLGVGSQVAINLSPRNMSDPQLLEDLWRTCEDHRVAPSSIELEITESAILHATERVLEALASLRARGMKVSIDDFGTGYTSLSYLADLPVDGLKIDQSFTRNLLHDARTSDIVQAIIDLARKLRLYTVAEGVEDQATAARLREMGCDIGQGYFFCRPMAKEAIDAWVTGLGQRH